MKKLSLFILIFTLLVLSNNTSIAQNLKSAGEYNNFIVNQNRRIMKKNLKYIQVSVHSKRESRIDSKRKAVVKEIERSITNLERIDGWNDNTEFRDNSIKALKRSLQIYENEFKEVNVLQQTAYETYESLKMYYDAERKAIALADSAFEKVVEAQEEFADEHDLTLVDVDSKIHEQLKGINEVTTYCRDIFLLYFKVERPIALFFDAIYARDVDDAEEQIELIKKSGEESLAELEETEAFKNDNYYTDKAIKLVDFYMDFASDDFEKLLDYLSKGNDMKQADINRINAIINNYNNKSRSYHQSFTAAYERLMRKHVPKDLK